MSDCKFEYVREFEFDVTDYTGVPEMAAKHGVVLRDFYQKDCITLTAAATTTAARAFLTELYACEDWSEVVANWGDYGLGSR